jgi:TRAP-type C4-dicarboxylate transport system substrate-binding protein
MEAAMRHLVGAAVAGALWVVASSHAEVAAGPAALRIKLATAAPKDTSYHRSLLQMGERWRAASDGRIELVIYPGGNQGSEADTVRRMNIGELQAAMLTAGGLTDIDPAVAALEEIPMLFRSLAEAEYVRSGLRPELERRLQAKGFVPLFWTDTGWMRLFSRTAAVTPDDFKRLKIFVTASGSEQQMSIMQALGYRPVPLDFADALIQLQTGGVDAVPTIPIVALVGQYYTVARHMLGLNWAPVVGGAVITQRAWDAVPPALREALLQAAAATGARIQEQSRRENEEAVAMMALKWKLEVHAVSPQLELQWRTFAEGVYPKIRGRMVPADMFDRATQLAGEYRSASK